MHLQVLWDVQKAEALCGAPLLATDVSCFPGDAQRFATCGADSSLLIWRLDRRARKLAMHQIQVRFNRKLRGLLLEPRHHYSSCSAIYSCTNPCLMPCKRHLQNTQTPAWPFL